jgi:hypothetical protein
MKYLKKYKLFESTYTKDDIEDDISDLLLSLSDTDIVIDPQPKYYKGKMYLIEIYISSKGGFDRDKPGFKLTPYIDELNHLNDFLEDKGWVLNSDPSVSDRNYGFDKWIANVEKSNNSYKSVPLFYVPKDDKVLKVIAELSSDTIIDFEKKHIIFPFMEGHKPYPFEHLTPNHYIFFVRPTRPNTGGPVPPFIRYCKSKYGVTDDEMESVWKKYKHRMWERMIEPR